MATDKPVEFLLEEASAEAALRHLVPRLLPGHACRYRVFEGCRDLLEQLPRLLPAYRRRMQQPGQEHLRVVVLLDADNQAADRLARLEQCAATAGLTTWPPARAGQSFQVLNCLAVQELEAWFLGDRPAIQAAYGRVHPHHFAGLPADPEAIPDAWETLLRVLRRADQTATKAKVAWARAIAPHLDPERTTSASFRGFCQGLAALR